MEHGLLFLVDELTDNFVSSLVVGQPSLLIGLKLASESLLEVLDQVTVL